MRIAFLELNDFHLEIIEDPKAGAPPARDAEGRSSRTLGFSKLAFWIPDVDSVAAALKKNGNSLLMEPTDNSDFDVRFFLVKDNAGNTLQFFSPRVKARN